MPTGFSRRFFVPLALIGLFLLGTLIIASLAMPVLLAIRGEGATALRVLVVAVVVFLLVGLAVVGWRLMRHGEFRPHWSRAYLQLTAIFGILLFTGAVLSTSPVLPSLGFALFVLGGYGMLFGIIGYFYGGGRGRSLVS